MGPSEISRRTGRLRARVQTGRQAKRPPPTHNPIWWVTSSCDGPGRSMLRLREWALDGPGPSRQRHRRPVNGLDGGSMLRACCDESDGCLSGSRAARWFNRSPPPATDLALRVRGRPQTSSTRPSRPSSRTQGLFSRRSSLLPTSSSAMVRSLMLPLEAVRTRKWKARSVEIWYRSLMIPTA